MTILLCAIFPLAGILLTLGPRPERRALAALLLVAGLNALVAVALLTSTPVAERLVFGEGYLVSDALSRLFLALISMVFVGVGAYIYNRSLHSTTVVRDLERFVRLVLLFLSLAALAILSHHLIAMWVLIEATTLAAVPLIYHQRGSASFRAAWQYCMFSAVGLGLVFLGLVCLGKGMETGLGAESVSFFFDRLAALNADPSGNRWTELGLVLVIFGFGSKLGLAPMYSWLPDTYDSAPPSVTVLLAAVQFNCVILALFRVFEYFHPARSGLVRYELMAMGLSSIVLAALSIIAAQNYKRLIAYASINHAGVIAIGLSMGKNAAYGVVLYVLSNALVKSVLFLTCGNIKARYQTKKISDLQGLIKGMPYSGGFFMIGIFALLGFAPFGGFMGEVIIMTSMVELKQFVVFTLFCFLLTVIFVATGRSTFPMIWGEPMGDPGGRGESIYTLLPNLFYVFLLISLGIYLPASANGLLREIASRIGGG